MLVIETTITLLTKARLSSELWYFACAHSIYLINKMPCRTLLIQSPYSLLYKKALVIQNLKNIWKCSIPWFRPYNANKLQPRSIICVFIGYSIGYKGVICFHVKTRKCIISKHVFHDETCFPCKQSQYSLPMQQDNQEQVGISSVLVPIPVFPSSPPNIS